jgi:dCTP deaminase
MIATAVGIHPLFFGSLTLEIRNLGETPIRLYPGQAIAQLFFHKIQGKVAADDTRLAQYSGTTDPVPNRLSRGNTAMVLQHLRNKRRAELFDMDHTNGN